jgi:hypothetical protein
MRSPAQVRHTLRYVLRNVEHHSGRRLERPDSRASAVYLTVDLLPAGAPVSLPRTWLLRSGWRKTRAIIRGLPAAGFDEMKAVSQPPQPI